MLKPPVELLKIQMLTSSQVPSIFCIVLLFPGFGMLGHRMTFALDKVGRVQLICRR